MPCTVIVNGETRELPDGTTVDELLRRMDLHGAVCAAEVNRAVVRRADRATLVLREGDRVEIVTLVGGG